MLYSFIRKLRLPLGVLAVAALVLGLASREAAPAAAAPPPGGNWAVHANGHSGTLNFSVDAAGNVSGTILGDAIVGFWDEQDQKISFVRTSSSSQHVQTYTGYFFRVAAQSTAPTCYLTRFFATFSAASGGTPARNVYGWAAVKSFC